MMLFWVKAPSSGGAVFHPQSPVSTSVLLEKIKATLSLSFLRKNNHENISVPAEGWFGVWRIAANI